MPDPNFKIANEHKPLAARVALMLAMIIVANLILWILAVFVMQDHPILISTAILAYMLGLRHAIDPDHLAAIDNVTRKLTNDGKVPLGVGFCFALGHSAFVLLVVMFLTASAVHVNDLPIASLQSYGEIVSTFISTVFLLSIGFLNLSALRNIKHKDRQTLRQLSTTRLWTRFVAPLFADIRSSRGMIFIGFLFALSFDTATEISLFGMGAAQAVGHNLPMLQILIFPVLFAAGMTLVDMINSIAMLGAYRWSSQDKGRQRKYYLTITTASALLAIAIGGANLIRLLGNLSSLPFEFYIFGDRPELFGAIICALFIIIWMLAIVADRFHKLARNRVE